MTAAGGAPSPTAIAAQLATMVERLDGVVSKLDQIEGRMVASDNARHEFRVSFERRVGDVEARVTAVNTRIEEHERADQPKWAQVERLAASVKELEQSNFVLKLLLFPAIGAIVVGVTGWFLELLR